MIMLGNPHLTKRGNPQWGKYAIVGPAQPTKWEKFLAKLNMSLEDAARSPRVREWAYKHRHTNYVPEEILLAHGITTNFEDPL